MSSKQVDAVHLPKLLESVTLGLAAAGVVRTGAGLLSGMGYVFTALWQGLVAGAVTKPGTIAPKPAYTGIFASVADALHTLGFTISTIVVHGKSPG